MIITVTKIFLATDLPAGQAGFTDTSLCEVHGFICENLCNPWQINKSNSLLNKEVTMRNEEDSNFVIVSVMAH